MFLPHLLQSLAAHHDGTPKPAPTGYRKSECATADGGADLTPASLSIYRPAAASFSGISGIPEPEPEFSGTRIVGFFFFQTNFG